MNAPHSTAKENAALRGCQIQEAHPSHEASGAQHCTTVPNTSPKGQCLLQKRFVYCTLGIETTTWLEITIFLIR